MFGRAHTYIFWKKRRPAAPSPCYYPLVRVQANERRRKAESLLNVGVTTLTERVPTATPGDDRGEEAKLRWEWVLESGGVGRWGMMGAGIFFFGTCIC